MKRILFIASQPFFEWRGSPIRLGFDLLALTQLGYTVDFLTLPLGERREIPGVNIVRAPNLFGARRIAIGPSMLKLAFDGVLFWMALGRVIRHRYAVVHGVEDCGLIAWVAARAGRARLVFERHSDPSSYHQGRLRNAVMAAYAAVERFVMRRADVVIGTGPGLVAHAQSVGRASRACLIPDIPSSLAEATAAGKAAARARCVRQPDDLLITYVGSFAVYQGIELLFAAIPSVAAAEPRARFIIVGGTPEEISTRKAALAAAGCSRAALFLGYIDPDQLPDTLAASDILLSPRIAGMNTPLKLLDYLKAGAAIVATDCEANRLILTPENAQLTPVTPEGFAEGVLALCRDSARRARLAQSGADLLATRHTFTLFRDALRQCYTYVLNRNWQPPILF
jgi:glycosyltransferase involved in cell wall biosynthesis